MKSQSQARAKRAANKPVSQAKTPQARAGEPHGGGATVIVQYPDGREWGRADFGPELTAALEAAATELRISFAEVCRIALESKVQEEPPANPATAAGDSALPPSAQAEGRAS
jgi:hypothetical protein